MQRLTLVNPAEAQGQTKELLDTVQQAFGTVPNVAKVLANSSAVLQSYLAFAQAMGAARIGEKLHHQVKLATSEENSCEYCTSILSELGSGAGLSAEDVIATREGHSNDELTDAALAFTKAVLDSDGKVTNTQLNAVRDAGFDDGEIVEIIASAVLGTFTNFVNNVADTELDIPRAEPVTACSGGTCEKVA